MRKDWQKNLVVLAPDKNIEFAVRGLLSRQQAIGIAQITSEIHVHPQRDPGCLLTAHSFLRQFANSYAHALVIFDREGCGQEEKTREALEEDLEERLSQNGWEDRAAAIALDPEIEIWVWSDSPRVDSILGWEGRSPDLRSWLVEQGFIISAQAKPSRPKEAMEQALRMVRKSRSSALFLQLAQKVSLDRCVDPAFLKLKEKLRLWFS